MMLYLNAVADAVATQDAAYLKGWMHLEAVRCCRRSGSSSPSRGTVGVSDWNLRRRATGLQFYCSLALVRVPVCPEARFDSKARPAPTGSRGIVEEYAGKEPSSKGINLSTEAL